MKLDGTGHHHVKRNKPDSETHATCFFLYAISILDFLNAMEIEEGIFWKKTRGREKGEENRDVRW